MPYSSTADLPDKVKVLPAHAQKIFLKAFNASFKEFGEERAFKIAWAAVKKVYKKEGDKWVKSSEALHMDDDTKKVMKKMLKKKMLDMDSDEDMDGMMDDMLDKMMKQMKKKKVKDKETLTWNYSVPINVAESAGRSMSIHGLAIEDITSRNNVTYTSEELRKATNSMVGKPIIKDHNASVDSIVGTVKRSEFMNGKVYFDGEIMDEGVKEKIKDGRIKYVSIGASAEIDEIYEEETKKYVARDIKFNELSLVVVPGIENAGILTFNNALEEAFKKIESDDSDDEYEEEVEDMETENTEVEAILSRLKEKENEMNKLKEDFKSELESQKLKVIEYEKAIESLKTSRKNELLSKVIEQHKRLGVEAQELSKLDEASLSILLESLSKVKLPEKEVETKGRVEEKSEENNSGFVIEKVRGGLDIWAMPTNPTAWYRGGK